MSSIRITCDYRSQTTHASFTIFWASNFVCLISHILPIIDFLTENCRILSRAKRFRFETIVKQTMRAALLRTRAHVLPKWSEMTLQMPDQIPVSRLHPIACIQRSFTDCWHNRWRQTAEIAANARPISVRNEKLLRVCPIWTCGPNIDWLTSAQTVSQLPYPQRICWQCPYICKDLLMGL